MNWSNSDNVVLRTRTLSMTFCAYSPDMATVKYDEPKMEFQNESRFALTIYPKPAEISIGDELFA